MVRELTCIVCPTGCALVVTVDDGLAVRVEGNGCRRGRDYAVAEVEHPERLLTTTVPAIGLSLRMVPVRTSRSIPRDARTAAMSEIRKARVSSPVKVGEVILADLLGLGVDVVATRDVA